MMGWDDMFCNGSLGYTMFAQGLIFLFPVTKFNSECENQTQTGGYVPCTDLEGGQGVRTPLKNPQNIGFLSNTGPDPPEIIKLPSQNSMLGNHQLKKKLSKLDPL